MHHWIYFFPRGDILFVVMNISFGFHHASLVLRILHYGGPMLSLSFPSLEECLYCVLVMDVVLGEYWC